jgi:GNAT superfamily N-acetyltransferase
VSGYSIRAATLADRERIARLIATSAREVATSRYSARQVEGALRGAFGVDSQLIEDGSYFVVECAGGIVACGGWSRRRTLFGGDRRPGRDGGELDPGVDAARIRAFFVDPRHLRRGLASLVLDRCEAAARLAGFSRFELMGTLSGVPFYESRGYVAGEPVSFEIEAGLSIDFLAMRKG